MFDTIRSEEASIRLALLIAVRLVPNMERSDLSKAVIQIIGCFAVRVSPRVTVRTALTWLCNLKKRERHAKKTRCCKT